MIGRKKLKTIREELQRALTSAADDPIEWLEQRLVIPKNKGTGDQVLASLRRILEDGENPKPRKGRAATKK